MAIGLFGSKGDAHRDSNSSNDFKDDVEQGRLEKPSRKDMDDSSDQSITVGKQMELEAENAIKYRTCSWPKVCRGGRDRMSNTNLWIDRRAPLLRVHLSGHHVLSMVILNSWPSTRSNLDRSHCRTGSLYVVDHLVSFDGPISGHHTNSV
jgi:hypothetical protein